MAATTTSCGRRARILGGALVLAAVVALGCGGTSSQTSDGGPRASCGGTIDFKGSTSDGLFTATSVYVEVSSNTPTCQRGLQFVIGDSATGATFQFEFGLSGLGDGLGVPFGPGSVYVHYAGPPSMGLNQSRFTTPGKYNITASDPPPFATCEQSPDAAVDLRTGNIAMSLSLSETTFAIAGTLSTPYCACRPCLDTI